jgi:glycosyltransferase involved in cell wall biosynthesis
MIDGLVSTIIPVHNRAGMLREAVTSALAQIYRPIEIIIVDDGSTDDTAEVCDELASHCPDSVSVVHQLNTGPGVARETGREAARGEFIQYLDSDDLLLPRKFELQVAGLSANPNCGVSYGKTRYRDIHGRVEDVPWKGSGTKVTSMFPSFLRSRWWDTPTPLYRASLLRMVGPWENLSVEEDWEYDCRIAALGTRLHYCDEFVAEVRDHNQRRLCRNGLNGAALRDRARAHELILAHAFKAGITAEAPEMRHFARELFLLCRQCGAAGLTIQSQRLFDLSKIASGPIGARGWDFRAYETLASLLGWRLAGRVACLSDNLRRNE